MQADHGAVFKLVLACPIGAPAATCPLASLRSHPLHEQASRVGRMDEAEARALLKRHVACAKRRQA